MAKVRLRHFGALLFFFPLFHSGDPRHTPNEQCFQFQCRRNPEYMSNGQWFEFQCRNCCCIVSELGNSSTIRPVGSSSTSGPVPNSSTTRPAANSSTTLLTTSSSTTRPVTISFTTRTFSKECNCEFIRQQLTGCPSSIDTVNNICEQNHLKTCKAYRLFVSAISCLDKKEAQEIDTEYIKGSVSKLHRTNLSNFLMALPSKNDMASKGDDVQLQIPRSAFSAILEDANGTELNITTLWFKNDRLFPVEETNSQLLNNRVVAIELGRNIFGLKEYIEIIFYHQNTSLENVSCVFWDIDENGTQAHWNKSGCHSEIQDGKIICACDHLSFFAVLLSPVSKPLSSSSLWTLTLLSRIGCSVSVVFLALALFIHAVFRRRKSDHSLSIHIHLCAALLCLNLFFLINDSLTALDILGVCTFIAAATHFSLLATLTWFAIEGFHLYLLIIRVFNIYVKRYLLKLALVGWGFPAVSVIAILSTMKYGKYSIAQLDGTANYICWLNDQLLAILTFAFFVLVFLVNMVIFIIVTVRVARARQLSPAILERGVTKRDILSLVGLSWLLGVSWGVLLFQFGPLAETSFFIFCIFNSLHGFFLFLRYWSLNRRKESANTMASTATSVQS